MSHQSVTQGPVTIVRIRRETGHVVNLNGLPVTVSGQTKKIRSGEVQTFEVTESRIEVSVVIGWSTPSCWTISAKPEGMVDVELRSLGSFVDVGGYELKPLNEGVDIEPIQPKDRQFPADDIGGVLSLRGLLVVIVGALMLRIMGGYHFGRIEDAPPLWLAAVLALHVVILVSLMRLTVHVKRSRSADSRQP